MENFNKNLVGALYSRVFGQGDKAFASQIIAENYIQHNPMVRTGRAGFLEFLDQLALLPAPEQAVEPFIRMMAEGDLVAVHSEVEFMGQLHATVDIYRIENELLAEHWDASQVIQNGKPRVRGNLEIDLHCATEKSKQTVGKLWEAGLKQVPHLQDMQSFCWMKDSRDIRLHRLIGEHNFVLSHAEGVWEGKPCVFCDVFELKGGQVTDHWWVSQAIPGQMAHENGMF